MSVRIVVPCFNEAARLDVDAFAELAHHVDQVLFVDDGSIDGTGALIDDMIAEHGDSVGLIALPRNAGKAEAVRVGLLESIDRGSTLVGYLDADLATPGAEMLRLIDIAAEQPHRTAVLGSRVALLGHTVRRRPARHYLGRLYATAASLVLGVAVYDTQCGAKVFRVGTPLQLALAEPFHDPWSFDVELLGRVLATPGQPVDPVLEVPLTNWSDVSGSAVSPAAGVRALWDLIGLRRRVRRHQARYG